LTKTSLQLEAYFYPKISIEANREYKRTERTPQSEIEVNTKFFLISKDERRWEVSLTIKTIPKEYPIPYAIDIEAVGFFKVDKRYPEGETEKLIHIGAPTILYSATREFILTISSRGPWGPIYIPSTSFLEKPKEKEKTEIPEA